MLGAILHEASVEGNTPKLSQPNSSSPKPMALKSSISKVRLNVSNLDTNAYSDFNLAVARNRRRQKGE